MHRHRLMFIVLFVALLISIMPVFADWTLIHQSGEWEIAERNHWKKTNIEGDGNLTWQINLTSFNAYHGEVMFTSLWSWRDWWSEQAYQRVELRFELTDGVTNFRFFVRFEHWQALWGLKSAFNVRTYCKVNASGWSENWEEGWDGLRSYWADHYDINRTLEFFVELSGDYISVNFFNHRLDWQEDGEDIAEKWVIPSDDGKDYVGSFSPNLMTMTVIYTGKGQFEAYYQDEFGIFFTYPPGKTKSEKGLDILARIPYVGQLLTWVHFVFAMISTTIVTFVRLGLPFIGLIVLFWILDAIITAAQDGDLHPLGNVFMTIFDFLRALFQTIASIISAIKDAVKWW